MFTKISGLWLEAGHGPLCLSSREILDAITLIIIIIIIIIIISESPRPGLEI
jgi:hypothetical protein